MDRSIKIKDILNKLICHLRENIYLKKLSLYIHNCFTIREGAGIYRTVLKISISLKLLSAKLFKIRLIRYFVYFVLVYNAFRIISALILPASVFSDPCSKILLSSDKNLLSAVIAPDEQWRFPAVNKIPDKYKKAVIAFEDKRFYLHPGLDPVAFTRALIGNIKAGKIVSGGSTITMQVIRLSRKNKERTIPEKILEIFLSFGLELRYSKNEIFELYASHAPFGGNIVGLEAASRRYFKRSASKLSWAESCMLAVLPNSPSLIHPGRNRSVLKHKRDRLLKKLWDEKVISELEYKLSIAETLPGKPHPFPVLAGHLLNTLSSSIPEDSFYRSTIDYNLQKKLARVINNHAEALRLRRVNNISALVIDNANSEVIAYFGNADNGKKDSGQDIDIIQRPRSTGSILKPFLYAAMLNESEILPTTLVADVPTNYNGYMPENYDLSYRGAVPAYESLYRSLNVPAVRMLKKYGIHRFYHLLKKIGMTTLFRKADDYGLSLILGGAEGTLWEITCMYAYLARQATYEKPEYIKILKNAAKKYNSDFDFEPSSAFLALKAMLEVTRPGDEGYWKNFDSSMKVSWKTGTSFGLRDAWAVGCTSKYTVGVWAGNADGTGINGLTGISAAAPVLFDIFNSLPRSKWFTEPRYNMKPVYACKESGYIATDLCEKEQLWIPFNSNFSEVCPYHKLVHTDQSGKYQVSTDCEPGTNILHKSWFVLPPVLEFYYKKFHSEYKILPGFRNDCVNLIAEDSEKIMNLIYPPAGTRIYIPVDLSGKLSKTVFRAVHRNPETKIYWHLDDNYLGSTKIFHEMMLSPDPGKHTIILIDESGNRLERRFEVLGKEG